MPVERALDSSAAQARDFRELVRVVPTIAAIPIAPHATDRVVCDRSTHDAGQRMRTSTRAVGHSTGVLCINGARSVGEVTAQGEVPLRVAPGAVHAPKSIEIVVRVRLAPIMRSVDARPQIVEPDDVAGAVVRPFEVLDNRVARTLDAVFLLSPVAVVARELDDAGVEFFLKLDAVGVVSDLERPAVPRDLPKRIAVHAKRRAVRIDVQGSAILVVVLGLDFVRGTVDRLARNG